MDISLTAFISFSIYCSDESDQDEDEVVPDYDVDYDKQKGEVTSSPDSSAHDSSFNLSTEEEHLEQQAKDSSQPTEGGRGQHMVMRGVRPGGRSRFTRGVHPRGRSPSTRGVHPRGRSPFARGVHPRGRSQFTRGVHPRGRSQSMGRARSGGFSPPLQQQFRGRSLLQRGGRSSVRGQPHVRGASDQHRTDGDEASRDQSGASDQHRTDGDEASRDQGGASEQYGTSDESSDDSESRQVKQYCNLPCLKCIQNTVRYAYVGRYTTRSRSCSFYRGRLLGRIRYELLKNKTVPRKRIRVDCGRSRSCLIVVVDYL